MGDKESMKHRAWMLLMGPKKGDSTAPVRDPVRDFAVLFAESEVNRTLDALAKDVEARMPGEGQDGGHYWGTRDTIEATVALVAKHRPKDGK